VAHFVFSYISIRAPSHFLASASSIHAFKPLPLVEQEHEHELELELSPPSVPTAHVSVDTCVGQNDDVEDDHCIEKLTVVLDLDETLVCAYETSSVPAMIHTQAMEAGLKWFEIQCVSSDKVYFSLNVLCRFLFSCKCNIDMISMG
jgi:RNA polymerase II subunit A small phosphatase-like protein